MGEPKPFDKEAENQNTPPTNPLGKIGTNENPIGVNYHHQENKHARNQGRGEANKEPHQRKKMDKKTTLKQQKNVIHQITSQKTRHPAPKGEEAYLDWLGKILMGAPKPIKSTKTTRAEAY